MLLFTINDRVKKICNEFLRPGPDNTITIQALTDTQNLII